MNEVFNEWDLFSFNFETVNLNTNKILIQLAVSNISSSSFILSICVFIVIFMIVFISISKFWLDASAEKW